MRILIKAGLMRAVCFVGVLRVGREMGMWWVLLADINSGLLAAGLADSLTRSNAAGWDEIAPDGLLRAVWNRQARTRAELDGLK